MNRALIDEIYAKHNTAEGRETLYNDLAQIETSHWYNIETENIANWTILFRKKATTFKHHVVITEVETQTSFSYEALDLASEKICDYILSITADRHIGLNFHNSFAFLATLIGINKAGRLAILFNNREPRERLASLATSTDTHIVFGDAIDGLKHIDINEVLNTKTSFTPQYPMHQTTLEDAAFVIFTSGTSGPSKPALFSHRRMIGAGVAWSLRTAMDERDRCYITLPLYHGNGLAVAFSAVLYAGARAVIRKRFSVSHFFDDVNQFQCTHMVYIGELWRYITTKDMADTNPNKYLKVIFGNGLNRSLWEEVIKRYEITHVVEHFGATEMPAGALTNWIDIPGFCGYIPPSKEIAHEMILIDQDLKEVNIGENGEAVFHVPSGSYRGYLDPSLDAPKVIPSLVKEGDLWWRSGDLLRQNREGFYTFVDRLGDTYRFKGENVACADVEEALRKTGFFDEAVVYGIALPGIDGKIGMASVVCNDKTLDLKTLFDILSSHLAPYALPYIIKLNDTLHQTTSTLKIQKPFLAKMGIEAYLTQPHYILINNAYQSLDEKSYNEIMNKNLILGARNVQ